MPFPSPGDLPNPGIESRSPTLQADALTSELPGKPIYGLFFIRRIYMGYSLLEVLLVMCINDQGCKLILLLYGYQTELLCSLCEIHKLKFKCLLMTHQVLETRRMPNSAASFHALHLCGPALLLFCAPIHQTYQVSSCCSSFALINSP